jgi:membrane fusion protein (multidrug efflux system)
MVVGEGHTKDPQTGEEKKVESAAVRRPIVTDRLAGSNWVVTGGLKQGDRIIVDGLPKAKENAPVNASPAQAAPADGAPAGGAPAKAGSSAAPAGKQ